MVRTDDYNSVGFEALASNFFEKRSSGGGYYIVMGNDNGKGLKIGFGKQKKENEKKADEKAEKKFFRHNIL